MLFILKRTLLSLRSTFVTSLSGPPKNNWDGCGSGIDDVLSGRNLTYNRFSRQEILSHAWLGDIRGLNPELRNDTFYLTYEGCLAICPDRTIGYNTSSQGLNVVATWIFPLAILFSLPFERNIFRSVTNWLGSPQTALTASIWNFWQIRQSYRRARRITTTGRPSFLKRIRKLLRGPSDQEIRDLGEGDRNRINAFYVLSCFNQFDLGFDQVHHNREAHDEQVRRLEDWLTTLMYGLFRPLAEQTRPGAVGGGGVAQQERVMEEVVVGVEEEGVADEEGVVEEVVVTEEQHVAEEEPVVEGGDAAGDDVLEQDILQTRELLSELAQDLRENRRKGVFQTLSSLVIFMMAFGFSIVLAFDDLSSSTSIFVLDIGIFYLWVPVLVVFILDRNPADSDRQKRDMSLWLRRVEAIRMAARVGGGPNPRAREDVNAIGDFIGQGRVLSYCGLTDAVIEATEAYRIRENWQANMDNAIPRAVIDKLSSPRKRPRAWHIITLVCLALVWIDIVWAAWADFITPTFGPGCWSLAFMFYGFFSTITWAMQYRQLNPSRPVSRAFRRLATWVSHFFNTLAVLYMILMLIVFSGGFLNNCFCNSCMGGFFKGYGGYVDFQGFEYYRDNFGLTNPWIGLAVSASSVSIAFLLTALCWWLECRLLWADQPRPEAPEPEVVHGPGPEPEVGHTPDPDPEVGGGPGLAAEEGEAIELQPLRIVAD